MAEKPEQANVAILKSYRVVAVVGLSPKPERPSYQVAQYLQNHGYRIVPVNPGCREILGEKCYPGLKDIPFPVEVVDIFRQVDAIPAIVADAIARGGQGGLDATGAGGAPIGKTGRKGRPAGGHEPLYEGGPCGPRGGRVLVFAEVFKRIGEDCRYGNHPL